MCLFVETFNTNCVELNYIRKDICANVYNNNSSYLDRDTALLMYCQT